MEGQYRYHGKHHHWNVILRKIKDLRHLLTVKAAQPDAVNADFLCLVHHSRGYNGRVLLSGAVVLIPLISRIPPCSFHIIANQHHKRRIKMGDADAPYFLQRLFALHHIDALGLIIAGSRRSPACFQDLIDLFLFHRTRIKVSFGIALRC